MVVSPAVSVLMPVYNSSQFLSEAIDSILEQSLTDFELVIIDDGSTDGSLVTLKNYVKKDPRIKLVTRENRGISSTRNELVSLAAGKYIAWMDSDDVSHKRRLEKQVTYLSENLGIVAVGSLVNFIDDDGDKICRWNVPLTNNEIDKLHIVGSGAALIFPASMMVKQVVDSVGGFDESLTGAEDLCLFLRLSEKGKIENINELLFTYRLHVSSISHEKKLIIRQDTQKVINEARKRRGLPFYALNNKEVGISKADIYVKWGWWALKGNNIVTAKKYAKRAIYSNVFKLQSWKLLACAFRGY